MARKTKTTGAAANGASNGHANGAAPTTSWDDVKAASVAKEAASEAPTTPPDGPVKVEHDADGVVVGSPTPQEAIAVKRAEAEQQSRRFQRDIDCPLMADELAELNRQHLGALDQLDALEAELDAIRKDFAGKRKALEETERELRDQCRHQKVKRSVRCELRLRGSTVYVHRLDTGDVIDERAATREELQTSWLEEAPAEAAPPAPSPTKKRRKKPEAPVGAEG